MAFAFEHNGNAHRARSYDAYVVNEFIICGRAVNDHTSLRIAVAIRASSLLIFAGFWSDPIASEEIKLNCMLLITQCGMSGDPRRNSMSTARFLEDALGCPSRQKEEDSPRKECVPTAWHSPSWPVGGCAHH